MDLKIAAAISLILVAPVFMVTNSVFLALLFQAAFMSTAVVVEFYEMGKRHNAI